MTLVQDGQARCAIYVAPEVMADDKPVAGLKFPEAETSGSACGHRYKTWRRISKKCRGPKSPRSPPRARTATNACRSSSASWPRHGSARPAWVGEVGGKPHAHRLKWSSPTLAAAIAAKIIARHAQDPQPSYSLSPDDGADWDDSAADKALDAGDFDPTFQRVSITDRLVVLCNRAAERVSPQAPDVLFGMFNLRREIARRGNVAVGLPSTYHAVCISHIGL